jgi:hypothetical protein
MKKSQFGCVLFPRRRRGNNTKEQPFCIISNTHQNWEMKNADVIAGRGVCGCVGINPAIGYAQSITGTYADLCRHKHNSPKAWQRSHVKADV